MRDRALIRNDMIETAGRERVASKFNVDPRTTYYWGKDPEKQDGRRPPEQVTDFLFTDHTIPSALKWEYGMSFVQPAGFTVIQRSGLEALLDGRAYSGENHLADICACGTPLVWMVRDGKAKSLCIRCHR